MAPSLTCLPEADQTDDDHQDEGDEGPHQDPHRARPEGPEPQGCPTASSGAPHYLHNLGVLAGAPGAARTMADESVLAADWLADLFHQYLILLIVYGVNMLFGLDVCDVNI